MSIEPLDIQRRWKVVYVIGEACPDWLPPHDFLIYQNALPALSAFRPDLVLPSALFTESAGTVFNVEGRLMAVTKAVEPPGSAKPDWWIMSRIAQALGRCKMGYAEVSAVQNEIRKHLKSFPEMKKRIAFTAFAWDGAGGPVVSRAGRMRGKGERGIPLSFLQAGAGRLQGFAARGSRAGHETDPTRGPSGLRRNNE